MLDGRCQLELSKSLYNLICGRIAAVDDIKLLAEAFYATGQYRRAYSVLKDRRTLSAGLRFRYLAALCQASRTAIACLPAWRFLSDPRHRPSRELTDPLSLSSPEHVRGVARMHRHLRRQGHVRGRQPSRRRGESACPSSSLSSPRLKLCGGTSLTVRVWCDVAR